MNERDFAQFSAAISSRLRHDLKGGLISLRMGLEALSGDEELKPLLIERARDLEALSDKLITLLRMAKLNLQPVGLSAIMGEFKIRVGERFPDLNVNLPDSAGMRIKVDGEALLYAFFEIAENSSLAKASSLSILASAREGITSFVVEDDGSGYGPESALQVPQDLSSVGKSSWNRSGLGLAIVKACVDGHGGNLRLSGRSPKGFKLEFSLGGIQA